MTDDHLRALTDRLGELDATVAALRAELRSSPVLPLPGTGGAVRPGPVRARTARTTGTADAGTSRAAASEAVTARRLAGLFAQRDAVAAGLRAAQLRPHDLQECEAAAADWVNGITTAGQLLDEVVPDPAVPHPALTAPLGPRRQALSIAEAILQFRDRQPGRRVTQLAALSAVGGVTQTWLRHLRHTGRARLDDPEGTEPGGAAAGAATTVAVLLPVRIETRFRPGTLLLRVVPDEPWFARHDSRVSTGELDALGRYLAADAVAPDDAARAQAWRELIGHVGGARAVFLVRTFAVPGPDGLAVVRPPDPAEVRVEPALPRIEGFPETVLVWLVRGGGTPTLVHTLAVDRARLLADFPDPDVPGDHRWWEDWQEAVDAGLAAEIALDGDPDDIDALFVTGIGDGDPAGLFASHRDEGRLATLPPGTPTNTVDGAPTTLPGDDPDTWWDVLQTPASGPDRLVSASLTGDPDLLGNLPGPAEPQRELNAALVMGLWPALWGSAGQDVWALPGGTADASAWAPHALFPEGPFPTLRVGPQPYGLLPATALGSWVARPTDPPVEASLQRPLLTLRGIYAEAARARGTVVGAPTDRLLDLIGQVPTSPVFRHRLAWPLELWWLVLLLLGFGVGWEELDRAWRGRYRLATTLGLDAARRHAAVGPPRRLEIPLVVPPQMPADRTVGDVLRELVRLAFERPSLFARTDVIEQEFLRFPPDSLLLRLAIRALQVAIGDIGRTLMAPPEPPPRPEDVTRPAGTPSRLEVWIDSTPAEALHSPTPEAERFRRVVDGLLAVTEVDPARLERLLRATVDTAALRIDPWIVGPPTRRLQDLVDRGAADFRLGVYGWVDAPRPGTPGPTAAGLLHAPSAAQAMTATVLRDRAVSDPADGRWDLDLTSRSVRDADRAAEHVRLGAHLAEAVGREVERVVGDAATVARLRRDFPVRSEHAGRRVCDGLAVLAAAPATLGLDPAQRAGLDRLRVGLDTYGDLLVAEAVHHVTEGRAEVAGAVMDAAAGLARPPQLGLLRTPRAGRAVTTSVVLALRDVAEPPLPAGDRERAALSPAALADAAWAALVREQAGDAAQWTFQVGATDVDGGPVGAPVTVTLADLGILPADALALTRTDLERLAAAVGARLLGVEPARAEVTGGDAAGRYERAARLAALVGDRPAGPDALTEQADAAVEQAGVTADLLRRYVLVRDTAARLADQLDTDLVAVAGGGVVDADTLSRLVVAARSWGVAPDPRPNPASEPVEPDPEALSEQRLVATATAALALLRDRLATAPDTAAPSPGEPSPAQRLSRDDLVAALRALVSPTGQLAVTARVPRAAFPAVQADPALDREWLPTIAAVRDSLARLEVHQLAVGTPQGGSAFVGWSNKPGTPWQEPVDPRRLVVVYAAPTLDLASLPGGGQVALAAVDRFAEVVPEVGQTTAAAFGFDAPAARAPQAILLAVPPDLDRPLDDETVVDIVAETRLLARARMARPADLAPDVAALLPASLLPATGAAAVRLEPTRR